MTSAVEPRWKSMRTDETLMVEDALRKGRFQQVDAYRYNSASIRVRVIDPSFERLSPEKRDAKVERLLKQLPERTQADIIQLYTFAPSELEQTPRTLREFLQNVEFEDPSPSDL